MTASYKLCTIGSTPVVINGSALSGGKIYTYVAGSSTPKSTYTDSTGGTTNANPVVLDSNGIKPMWLATDANYKLIIKSSDEGTTYLTLDNVEGCAANITGSPQLSFVTDSNGNEVVGFSGVSSALNYINFTNSATGTTPIIKAQGDDINVGLKIDTQGTGSVTIDADTIVTGTISVTGALSATTTAASIVGSLGIGSSHYFSGIITPDVTANQNNWSPTGLSTCSVIHAVPDATPRTITGLDASSFSAGSVVYLRNGGTAMLTFAHDSGSSTAANKFFFADSKDRTLASGGGIAFLYLGSRWTSIGGGSVSAGQSEQETATSVSLPVTPSVQQFHPSATKAWARFTSVTTTALTASYNCSGVTDNGTGDTTVSFTTIFSSANYASAGICGNNSSGTGYLLSQAGSTPTASAYRVVSNSFGGAATDIANTGVIFCGDQ